MAFFEGLVGGIQEARKAELQRNLDLELQNRQAADRVFSYLLASRDPQLQQLALSGLMQPTGKKKGLAGFLGQVESNPYMDRVLARMNEWVPADGGGGPTPPVPGSAAMSANAPVEPGSTPINIPNPPAPPDWTQPQEDPQQMAAAAAADAAGPDAMPGLAAGGGVGVPPPTPPLESPWKRRGTSVPTAEEIAEATGLAQLKGRARAIEEMLTSAGATPDEIQDALMGLAGAPRNNRNLSAVSQFGVILPGQTEPVPVLLDQQRGYVTAGGQPLPQGAKMVRMSGASGGAGAVTSTMQDSDETRMWLIENGADPAQVGGGSPTGYWRVRQTPQGLLVQPGEYSPPPALSGTYNTLDTNNNQVVRGITRAGAPGPVLGAATTQPASDDQAAASALLDEVTVELRNREAPRFNGGPRRPLGPAERDTLVTELAKRSQLPYTTYQQLVQATKVAPARQVTPSGPPAPPSGAATDGATVESTAERVRRRALENRQNAQQGAPQAPPAPPRGRGAGPRR